MKRLSVSKFNSFEEAEDADIKYYAGLTFEERLEILISLIGNNGTIERSVRIYPITKSEES